jgi:uncharacterized protein involved in response to NO
MNAVKQYGIPFFIGGVVLSSIKYASQHMSQKYAAIAGALPLGLLSTLFIVEANKTDSYITNYTIQTLVTVFAGMIYLIGSHVYYKFSNTNGKKDITIGRVRVAYFLSVVTWLILSILKIQLIK